MGDHTKFNLPPGAGTSEDEESCGVSEALFPRVGKCCEIRSGILGTEYNGVCPCCSVLKLPIDSSSLEIVTFFECTRYGYGRRVKNSVLM